MARISMVWLILVAGGMNKVKQALNSTLTIRPYFANGSVTSRYVCVLWSVGRYCLTFTYGQVGGFGKLYWGSKCSMMENFGRVDGGVVPSFASPPPQLQTQRHFVHKFYFPVLANWNQIGTWRSSNYHPDPFSPLITRLPLLQLITSQGLSASQ